MEKDKILDPSHHSQMMKQIYRYRLLSLLGLSLMIFLAGCSLPRIIILKDPLTPEEHLNLGVSYEKKGELDQAIAQYRLAAKKLPLAYIHMGNAYFQKNEWAEAEWYYKKAIEKDPKNADAHNNLAWLYYVKHENLDLAESLALKAIELNPPKVNMYKDTLEKIRELKEL
jgi:tetratricopeptide (TPR) repeat protein